MAVIERLPGPCGLCGAGDAARAGGALVCASCGWRYGDAPDHDLPPPRIDVVYYVRAGARVKIGTSSRPRHRLAALRFDELLAFELGDCTVEHARHLEFAGLRGTGEWFRFDAPLVDHVQRLAAAGDPWVLYAQWIARRAQAG